MAGANPDPFFGITIASGPLSTPQPITNNHAGGPSAVMKTVISQLPPPIVTSQAGPLTTHGGSVPSTHTAPPMIKGGSGPSTHTTPPTIQGGSGPSTYIAPTVIHGGNVLATHTVPPTTHGGIDPFAMVPSQVPPVVQMHYAPANLTTIVAPSHINLGSNLPFMAHLNLPDLA